MVEKRVILSKDTPIHKTRHLNKQIHDLEQTIHNQEKRILELKQKINLIRKIGGRDYIKARQDLKNTEHELSKLQIDLKKLQKEEATYSKKLNLKVGAQHGVK